MAHLLGRRNRRRILLISRSEVRFQLPRFFCDLNDPPRGAAPHDETYFDFSSERVFVTNRDRAAGCRSLRIPETRATSDGIATPRLAQLGEVSGGKCKDWCSCRSEERRVGKECRSR